MKDVYSATTGRIPLVDEERGRQGLCTFCAAVARCALIEPTCMPVLQCEEFRTSFRKDILPDADPGDMISSEHVDHTDWGQKGLCGNCAILDRCPFTKDEGGVWRCEEYR